MYYTYGYYILGTIFLKNLGLVLPAAEKLVPKAEHGEGMSKGLRLKEGKWDVASTPRRKK